ncbi:MAG TPA: beta-galactosidase [Opitutales bacterium]|jgi:beta-galactosidase|nr:beta-galactosidase [Opitutales bacterium]
MTSTPIHCRKRFLVRPALLMLALAACAPAVAHAEVVSIDASVAPAAPVALAFPVGGKSPDGHELSINSRYFTRDGQPFFPVMGEFHYSRYPQSEWENEILKMKAGGITIISCYVIWIHHEETKDKFDFTGQKDLRAFVQLCAKHGMYVWVRIGPWDHAEVRNGGIPDWVLQDSQRVRSNDAAYMADVTPYFNQLGQQLKGLMWQDGGPVIGTQIENEYKGGAPSVAHLNTLLQLAQSSGIVTPFYTVTGWDQAAFPATGFLPVFGGYTEQFWSNLKTELPPNVNFFFDSHRAEDNVTATLAQKVRGYDEKTAAFPFLTAEMGGGMAIAYHRRPVMYADDTTAAALVKLGSGITLLGYYMYHGGTNPAGLTSLQEEQAQPDGKGYNDMEAKSYDFQAPLGEFGQLHPSYGTTKALHLFLNDFGAQLAPMTAYFADQQPPNTSDKTTARVTARADGKSAFIFINNYERNYALAEHKDFQVSLKLPSGTVTIPHTPTTIPTGEYTIWPVNLDMSGVNLAYATAEPLCKISDPDTYVFFAWPGTDPEFAIKASVGDTVTASHNVTQSNAEASADGPTFYLSGITPGTGIAFTVNHAGKKTNIIVLTRDQALNLYKANVAGKDRLFLSNAGLFFDHDQVHLTARNPADLKLGIFPALSRPGAGFTAAGNDGIFAQYTTKVDAIKSAATFTPTKPADPSVPATMGSKKNLAEPEDADFARAADWAVKFPADILAHPNAHPVLQINYQGDVARIYAGPRFADDNFYKGTPWEIGLWRFTPAELAAGLDLKILPLRADTKIFLEQFARPAFPADGSDVLNIKDISIAWDYDAILTAAP